MGILEWLTAKTAGHAAQRTFDANIMTERALLEREIRKFKASPGRQDMLTGEAYYIGNHDILKRKRTVIGEQGELKEVKNLPNNRVVDNQYSKLVDQKVNYLLAKPVTFETDSEQQADALNEVFSDGLLRQLKNVGEDSLNQGIAWLHPYYDDEGVLQFKRFCGHEILPFWRDSEHSTLDMAVRIYAQEAYEGIQETLIEHVEVYTLDGIQRFTWQNNGLVEDLDSPGTPYIQDEDHQEYNWERIPLIAFKYNNKEQPLINRVKSLQDGINEVMSDFRNVMQEDVRNTILIVKDYSGTDLGELRHNLATYGMMKIEGMDESNKGGVETLQIVVNPENYQQLLSVLKKAIIENGRGFDAKDERMAASPNQMNIQSMYADIDLDANGMESEWQASMEQLLWFIHVHLANTGGGNFIEQPVKVIFSRDVLVNEGETIDNAVKSVGLLSKETIIAQHPWTVDVQEELDRLEAEQEQAMEQAQQFMEVENGNLDGQAGDAAKTQ
jgi:SPP1 family phage portal protein